MTRKSKRRTFYYISRFPFPKKALQSICSPDINVSQKAHQSGSVCTVRWWKKVRIAVNVRKVKQSSPIEVLIMMYICKHTKNTKSRCVSGVILLVHGNYYSDQFFCPKGTIFDLSIKPNMNSTIPDLQTGNNQGGGGHRTFFVLPI